MRALLCLVVLISLGALTVLNASNDADIIGRASVIDGDTIEIRGRRLRLHGIDAPESGQTCLLNDGSAWPCGQQAALALSDFLFQQTVRCIAVGMSYDRVVATCTVGDTDIAAWLAVEGWAVAAIKYSRAYSDAERKAKSARRHIWQGAIIQPSAWRSGQRWK